MEVINNVQKAILVHFGEILESERFYLTGGTALAEFYLKHRRSDDLDFFTQTVQLIVPFSRRLEEMLKTKEMVVQRQRGLRSFVELLVKKNEDTTVVHLAEDSAFRFEEPKEFPGYPKLKVDSLIDAASNKFLALFGRATLRDFIDIYVLIKRGLFSPEELMEKAKAKDPGFDLYWLGVAFERIGTFKEDAPEMFSLVEQVNFHDMLIFFNRWREKISKKLKP